MRLGVIVTSYNSPGSLTLCLGSLAWQARRPDEVIVADDGSDPEPAAAIRSAVAAAASGGLPVHLATMERRTRSVAAVRNLGIRASSSACLVFLDGDIVLGPESVAAHEAAARPGLFLIGDRATLGREATEALLAAPERATDFEATWAAAERGHLDRVRRKAGWQRLRRRFGLAQRHKPQILACHFSVARTDLEAVNGFDERYVDWGCEDDDLAARLYMAGCLSRSLIREARAVHLWHPSRAPAKGAASPNREYFLRRGMRARCERGLVREKVPFLLS
jgi:GT2 family glycosyltransferase